MAQVRARKLRLRAADSALLRRGAALVERAFQSTSLSAGGRLYVARKLALGHISAGARSERLSLGIERRCAELCSRAVHAAAPLAGSRDVVWFRDALEPLCLLLERALLGGGASEWFWRLAVPGLGARTHIELAVHVLRALREHDGGPAVVAAAVLRALARDERSTLEVLAQVELATLYDALGLAPMPAMLIEERAAPQVGPSHAVSTASEARVRRLLAAAVRRRDDEPRWHWLACVVLLAERPALAAALDALVRSAQRLLSDAVRDAPRRGDEARASDEMPACTVHEPPEKPSLAARSHARPDRQPPPDAPARVIDHASRAGNEAHAREDIDDREPSVESSDESPATSSSLEPSHDTHAQPPAPPGVDYEELASIAWSADEQAPTCAGGLLFVLGVLDRIGMPDLLAQCEPAVHVCLPARVLVHVAHRLRVAPDDPMVRALEALIGAAPEHAWPLHAGSLHALRDAFARRAARYCRRELGMSLHTLVLRPALVSASATHLDVTYPLRMADARIRIAGLDIDPGWVPTLGRVVAFHYRDDLSALGRTR